MSSVAGSIRNQSASRAGGTAGSAADVVVLTARQDERLITIERRVRAQSGSFGATPIAPLMRQARLGLRLTGTLMDARFMPPSEQGNASQFGELAKQLVLKSVVRDLCGSTVLLAMMPVRATHVRRWIVAYREPALGEVPHFKIVRRSTATHLRRYPTRI